MKTKKTTLMHFTVIVPRLRGVPASTMRQYIREAVGGWKGGTSPDDPLFQLKRDDVVVRNVHATDQGDPATPVAAILKAGTTRHLDLDGPWLEGDDPNAGGCQTYARIELQGQRLISDRQLNNLIEAAREEGRQEERARQAGEQ